MSDYCHRRAFGLRYSDVDFRDEAKLSTYLSFAQEVAGSSADELGFGYKDLKPKHFGFIVANTYCKLLRPARLGETLSVETWPLPPRHVIFERDYRMTGENGETVAALASRWCLVDLGSFTMLLPEQLGAVHENCPYRAEKTVEVPTWKVPSAEDGREVYRMRIRSGHCDHYLHANNANYMDFFADCFSSEELSSRRIDAFLITYLKQAKEGEEAVFLRKDAETDSILEARVAGEPVARCRIFFREESI